MCTSFQYMLYVVAYTVIGVTYLDNIMCVISKGSSTIRLYNTDTFSPLDVVIDVTGMEDPLDIVVCRNDRQLYVKDGDYCGNYIWRVSVDDHSYVQWLNAQFTVQTLSMTSRRLLVTSQEPAATVRQYNTTNNELLCVVKLPQYVLYVRNAVETTHGTFVVGHRGTSQDKGWIAILDAVSELLRLCHVLQH